MNPRHPRYKWHRALDAVKRRRLSGEIDRLYNEITSSWDQKGFIERFRDQWDPFEDVKASKYLKLDWWLRDAIFRYLSIDIPRHSSPMQVLDIGMGTGYFLLVCRHMGHKVLGLDLPGEPLYNECHEFFGLQRITYRVEAMQPLPELPQPLDLATAFMTCFNQYEDKSPWEIEPWLFFLEDLRGRMTDRGRVVVKFNLNPRSQQFYSSAVAKAISGCGFFDARFYMDYMYLRVK
ncbi:MAG: class I SAM-dependent methyltransferase [Candidatus Latescibacterota bacterium]|nr:MAG: class I SAM-dependent methyltransferase [Candidatus Latescibacterota bacterium]